MFSNTKLKISLWYTLLLMVILATTFFAVYQIIGLKMKKEIKSDLKTKYESVEKALRESEHSERLGGEHDHEGEGRLGGEDGEEGREESNEGRSQRGEYGGKHYYYFNLQIYTEIANENYVLFIYSDNELQYLTEKYVDLGLEVEPFDVGHKQIEDVTISQRPFVLTSLENPDFTVYIGYELSVLSDIRRKLFNIFLIVLPLGLILSVVFGYFVTQSSFRVINKITLITDKITSSNLSERIDQPKGNDEITRLISTLNSMIDRLEKSFAQAKQFSQDAAHEIRTPLTIVRGEIEQLVEGEKIDEETSKTLEDILEEIQYLSSISERLLLIHNMDTSKIKYHFEEIDLSLLMEEIYQDVKVISSEKNLTIDRSIQTGIMMQGNKELITRMLWNIADNAIKYNKPNGTISLTLEADKQNIRIMVEDSGIGIPQEEIPKIFNRFYRVDKSRSRQLGGSGLGLSICKWIADLHNGSIEVESQENDNSKFSITLPM